MAIISKRTFLIVTNDVLKTKDKIVKVDGNLKFTATNRYFAYAENPNQNYEVRISNKNNIRGVKANIIFYDYKPTKEELKIMEGSTIGSMFDKYGYLNGGVFPVELYKLITDVDNIYIVKLAKSPVMITDNFARAYNFGLELQNRGSQIGLFIYKKDEVLCKPRVYYYHQDIINVIKGEEVKKWR